MSDIQIMGSMTKADDPGCVWLRFEREDAQKLEKGSIVSKDDMALALWFTPDAIRDHFEGEDGSLAAAIAGASDEQLREIGEGALGGDFLYREFHEGLRMNAEDVLDIPHHEG